jgi:hypothetical protein
MIIRRAKQAPLHETDGVTGVAAIRSFRRGLSLLQFCLAHSTVADLAQVSRSQCASASEGPHDDAH